jgi:hypothetical protein
MADWNAASFEMRGITARLERRTRNHVEFFGPRAAMCKKKRNVMSQPDFAMKMKSPGAIGRAGQLPAPAGVRTTRLVSMRPVLGFRVVHCVSSKYLRRRQALALVLALTACRNLRGVEGSLANCSSVAAGLNDAPAFPQGVPGLVRFWRSFARFNLPIAAHRRYSETSCYERDPAVVELSKIP